VFLKEWVEVMKHRWNWDLVGLPWRERCLVWPFGLGVTRPFTPAVYAVFSHVS
jgi:hypothetical protein